MVSIIDQFQYMQVLGFDVPNNILIL